MNGHQWGPPPRWGPPPGYRRSGPPLSVILAAAVVLVFLYGWQLAPAAGRVWADLSTGHFRPSLQLPKVALPELPTLPEPSRPAPGRAPAGLTFTDSAGCKPAPDYASPRLDQRVRALLVAAATHHRIRVSCIHTGHSYYVAGTSRVSNHTVWRAADIDQVDGRPVGRANPAALQLAIWIGRGGAGVQPSEVGSPWGFSGSPWFTDDGHQDHVHVGFDGPTQAGGR